MSAVAIRKKVLSERALLNIASMQPDTVQLVELTKYERTLLNKLSVFSATGNDAANSAYLDNDDVDPDAALLQAYMAKADSKLNSFIFGVSASIKDYISAMDCIGLYSADWFSSLDFSTDGKIQLAQALKDACAPYLNGDYSPVWDNIVAKDPQTLQSIIFTFTPADDTSAM